MSGYDEEITCPNCAHVWEGSPIGCAECPSCKWVHYRTPIGPDEAPCPDCGDYWAFHCESITRLRAENAELEAENTRLKSRLEASWEREDKSGNDLISLWNENTRLKRQVFELERTCRTCGDNWKAHEQDLLALIEKDKERGIP